MKWTENEIDIINSNYEKGATYLSTILNRNLSSIQHKLSRMKLKASKETKIQSCRINALKKSFKSYPYKVPDFTKNINEYSAYILGILWTDGYLIPKTNTVGITIVNDDMTEIEWIFNKIGNWYYKKRKRENKRESGTLTAHNPSLFKSLLNYEFDKKSYQSPKILLNEIPKKYHKYLIRGIIDGDGCFYINKPQYTYQLTISSCYTHDWSFYLEYFNEIGFNFKMCRRTSKKGNSSIIILCQRQKLIDFSKWLYSGYEEDRIGLYRKYQKSLLFNK